METKLNALRIVDLKKIASLYELPGRSKGTRKKDITAFLRDNLTKKQLNEAIGKKKPTKKTKTRVSPRQKKQLKEELQSRSLVDLKKIARKYNVSSKLRKELLINKLTQNVNYDILLSEVNNYPLLKRSPLRKRRTPVIQKTKKKTALRKEKLPNIRYLSGVTQIDYISGTYAGITRKFYLFYDAHTREGECPPDFPNTAKVNDWLLQKLARHTKFIDLFLEVGPPPPIKAKFAEKFFPESKFPATESELAFEIQYGSSFGTLAELNVSLKSCYSHHLFADCPYQDSRVHFTDIRRLFQEPSEYKIIQNFRFLEFFFNNEKLSKENYISFIMRNYVDNPKSKIYKEWLKSQFGKKWKPMVIQLIGIGYRIFVQSGKLLFDRFFAYIKDRTLIDLDDFIEYNDFINTFRLFDLIYMAILIHGVLQDIYTVARMFKRFSGEPEYAENIVYYAGGDHCEVVRIFLLEVLGFKLEYQTKEISETNFQCVDIQKLPWVY